MDLFAAIYKASPFTPDQLADFEDLQSWLKDTDSWDQFHHDMNEALVLQALEDPAFHPTHEKYLQYKEAEKERKKKDPLTRGVLVISFFWLLLRQESFF